MEETSQEDDQAMEIWILPGQPCHASQKHHLFCVSYYLLQKHCIFGPVDNHDTDGRIESEHERALQECRLHLQWMWGEAHYGGPSHVLRTVL